MCALTAFIALGGASAWAGQIVYDHAGEIWAMNEDGSNQHALFGVAQVPGVTSIDQPNVFANGGTQVAFTGNSDVDANASAGGCGVNCAGLYTYANGRVSQISGPPAPCACTVDSEYPHWMANGELQDNYSIVGAIGTLGITETVNSVPATAGAGVGTAVHLPAGNWAAYIYGPWAAPDPADATKIVSIGPEERCKAFIGECVRDLYVTTGGSSSTPVAESEVFDESPEWSSNGTRLAVLQGAEERGIWTFGAEAGPSNHAVFALKDPVQLGKSEPMKSTFSGVSWIGNSTIVFAAEGNIWMIPATCGSDGTPCEFPANATRLTSDGKDGSPSWTSSTQPLVPPATNSGGGSTSDNGSSPGPTNHSSAVVSSAQIASLIIGEIAPPGRGARHLARHLKAGAFALTFTVPEAGSATISWYFLPPHARLARKTHAKPVLVATGSHTFPVAGTATIEIRVTRAGKGLLRHAGRVKLTAKGLFMPVGSSPVSVVRQFSIRR